MSLKKYVLPAACVAAVGVACFCPELALATESSDISTHMEEFVKFDKAFDNIKSTAKTVIPIAIGFGLSIWATRYLFRLVKGMGRG